MSLSPLSITLFSLLSITQISAVIPEMDLKSNSISIERNESNPAVETSTTTVWAFNNAQVKKPVKKSGTVKKKISSSPVEVEPTFEPSIITPEESGIMKRYQKSDFNPGNKVFYFSNFYEGTTGIISDSAKKVETIDKQKGYWLKLKSKGYYKLALESNLPEVYTIEFDMFQKGIQQNSGYAMIKLFLSDDPNLGKGNNSTFFEIPGTLNTSASFNLNLIKNTIRTEKSKININGRLNTFSHVTLNVNKSRTTLYVDEIKILDIASGHRPTSNKAIIFQLESDGAERGLSDYYISNIKVSQIEQNSLKFEGIEFAHGSESLMPSSYNSIKKISSMIKDSSNSTFVLSALIENGIEPNKIPDLIKKRNNLIKTILINEFGVEESKIKLNNIPSKELRMDYASIILQKK